MKDYPEGLTQAERDVMWGFARRLADEAGMFDYVYAWLPEDLIPPTAAHFNLTPERVQELYKMTLDWMDIPAEDRLPPDDPRHDEDLEGGE
jgi:hypothetical protein